MHRTLTLLLLCTLAACVPLGSLEAEPTLAVRQERSATLNVTYTHAGANETVGAQRIDCGGHDVAFGNEPVTLGRGETAHAAVTVTGCAADGTVEPPFTPGALSGTTCRRDLPPGTYRCTLTYGGARPLQARFTLTVSKA